MDAAREGDPEAILGLTLKERRIGSLVVRADASDDALDWLAARLAAEPASEALVLGGLLVRVVDGALEEPDLSQRAAADAPERYLPGVTRALALAHEQWRVHQSYPDAPALAQGLFHGSRVAVGPGWDRVSEFVALRRAPHGSDSGWSIHPDMKQLGTIGEIEVRDVILRRPMLARFLLWPPGTAVHWGHGLLDVYVDGERRLPLAADSWLARRLGDATPTVLDVDRHRALIERFREHPGSVVGYADWIREVLLVSHGVAWDLASQIERHVAADALFELRFVRLLRQLLRQGRAPLAVEQVMQVGKLGRPDAEAFLARHRADLEAGKVPPR